MTRLHSLGLALGLATVIATHVPASAFEIRSIHASTNSAQAAIRLHPNERSAYAVPKFITGKFAEHLGWNIYHGMDAQILQNPTFADYPIWTGQMNPDGVATFYADNTRIDEELRHQALRFGWPRAEADAMSEARLDALACLWTRQGTRAEVLVSPDTGQHGGRAQRVQVKAGRQGLAQWTWLPLHRQRQYQIEVMARSPDLHQLTVAFWPTGGAQPAATAVLSGLSSDWQKLRGTLIVPAELPADASLKFTLTADGPGQFVVQHAFLLPADHIGGADPDIIRLLKESHLPLLRWPGGNFVSTYHWKDGIGPVEARPTKPNYAWGAIEPNTFGTDEFIDFCRAVGCEPMICINAGSGSEKEAAQWIEYCNGPATSPMGRLRAAHGHPEPFQVKHWEVGNELWGRWQMDWTTPAGYVDRFKRFAPAMLAADPTIQLYACGAPAMWGKDWNDTLIAGAGSTLRSITDHPLIGGSVSLSTDPLDVYRDFMGVPEVLQQKWAALRDAMRQGGIREPRLAVTELQLFAHLGRNQATNSPVRLTRDNLPGQASITEALYDVLIYHAAIRLAPFVELITHSAVVNHGGGLRKERERVWATPCYYAQAAFAAFAEAVPMALDVEAPLLDAPMVLPDLTHVTKSLSYSAVDALAAIAQDGALLVSIVNRNSSDAPCHVTIDLGGFPGSDTAALWTLSADQPWSQDPVAIQPKNSVIPIREGKADLDLPRFSVTRLRVSLRSRS